jgi:DNA repair photolyase
MIELIRAQRKSAVLTRSSLGCLAGVATVNLTAGCAHGCLYCYARGYSIYPGDGKVRLYANTARKLRDELRRRRKPRAVYFSSASDLFQPVPEILDLAYEVLELLVQSGAHLAFLTKGRIPRRHMELLTSHAPLVRAQIGLTTLNERVLRAFEPCAAPAEGRLAQAEELLSRGIPTQVRLDPILPGLTDDRRSLDALCSVLAEIGIRRIAAGVLFLRPVVTRSLRWRLRDREMLRRLTQEFARGSRLGIYAGRSAVTALPAQRRRELFSRLQRIANRHGIEAHICACKNPDIAAGCCHIAGRPLTPTANWRQLVLFDRHS